MQPMTRVLVTGANGNLGGALLRRAAGSSASLELRAAVRSPAAATRVASLPEALRPEVVLVDYSDVDSMQRAAEGCDVVIHLVGILREGRRARYLDAHEGSCSVLARAAAHAGVSRIVYASIVGSAPDAANACLASKGRAEQILLEGPVPATVLRVPMVLGPGDHASAALRREAGRSPSLLIGGGRTLQQPIDVRDVVQALVAASRDEGAGDHAFDLAGPECLPHRELVARAAAALGRPPPRIVPLPLGLARALVATTAALLPDPPITPAMLDVLQRDDRVDPAPACAHLDLDLTPLDDTLAYCLRATTTAQE